MLDNIFGGGGTAGTTTTTTTSQVTTGVQSTQNVTSVSSDYTTQTNFYPPTVRARTIIAACTNLKPSTAMNAFFSNTPIDTYCVPCTMLEISSTSTTFITAAISGVVNDNLTARTTLCNTYDTINVGEVIKTVNYSPATTLTIASGGFFGSLFGWQQTQYVPASGGTAIVIADETIYDSVSASNKRILYVTNITGNLSGNIVGITSQHTATIISSKAGTNVTNSLGNLYGIIALPADTFYSGSNAVLFTDATTPNPNYATTIANAGYISNGAIDTYTTNINYQTQAVTTITNTALVPTVSSVTTGGGSQGGGCFITTAMCVYYGLDDDCIELTVLRKFRDEYMTSTIELSAMIEEYYDIAPSIVNKIDMLDDRDYVYESIHDSIQQAVECIIANKYEEAVEIYADMVNFALDITKE